MAFIATGFVACNSDDNDEIVTNHDELNSVKSQQEDYFSSKRKLLSSVESQQESFNLFKDKVSNDKGNYEDVLKEANSLNNQLVIDSQRLFASLGVTSEEISDILGSENSSDIIIAALAFIAYEEAKGEDPNENLQEEANIIAYSAQNKYIDCAIEALGLNIFDGVRNGAFLTKKAAIQFLKKAAVRLLGPIGTAITVAEYGWCLGRS